ncbi:MAG: biotin/lipoyl-binding protein [Ignavibacteriota bacterium]
MIELETPPVERPRGKSSGRKTAWLGAIALLLVLAVGRNLARITRQQQAFAAAKESAINHPVVTVIQPVRGEPVSELLLPGNIQPLYSAALYARANGYLQQRSVDIGSRVTAGQVLAVISSPEIDQQLLQARGAVAQAEASLEQAKAALQQSKANAELARLTRDRDLPLGEQHAIPPADGRRSRPKLSGACRRCGGGASQHLGSRSVGLVPDVRSRDKHSGPDSPHRLLPFQTVDAQGSFRPVGRGTFVVRTASPNPLAVASLLRQEVTGRGRNSV